MTGNISLGGLRRRTRRGLRTLYYRLGPGRLTSGALRAIGTSSSDVYVFNEIFGQEDAYQRETLLQEIAGRTVLEIGAHKGYFTILAATHAGRVIAYEMDPRNYDYLLRNVAINRLNNVEAYNMAICGAAGRRQFNISEITDARHSLYASDFSGVGQTHFADTTTLEQVVVDLGIPRGSILKLDCEGCEYEVLMSAPTETLQKFARVYCELHQAPSIPFEISQVVDHMQRIGFTTQLYDEHQRDDMHTTMAAFILHPGAESSTGAYEG